MRTLNTSSTTAEESNAPQSIETARARYFVKIMLAVWNLNYYKTFKMDVDGALYNMETVEYKCAMKILLWSLPTKKQKTVTELKLTPF